MHRGDWGSTPWRYLAVPLAIFTLVIDRGAVPVGLVYDPRSRADWATLSTSEQQQLISQYQEYERSRCVCKTVDKTVDKTVCKTVCKTVDKTVYKTVYKTVDKTVCKTSMCWANVLFCRPG